MQTKSTRAKVGGKTRLGQYLLVKMKGLLPVVVVLAVVLGAPENESMKYRPMFMMHELSTLIITTELHASDSMDPQLNKSSY